jgi:hypothetical protein
MMYQMIRSITSVRLATVALLPRVLSKIGLQESCTEARSPNERLKGIVGKCGGSRIYASSQISGVGRATHCCSTARLYSEK